MTSLTSPTYSYPYPYQAVFDSVVAVLPNIPMRIAGADPATGTIVAKTPITFFKWGENITVRLWESAPGSTGISVTSSLKFGFMDPFGFNQGNLDRIFMALGANLDQYHAHLRTPDPRLPG